jgi:hypothetical protein
MKVLNNMIRKRDEANISLRACYATLEEAVKEADMFNEVQAIVRRKNAEKNIDSFELTWASKF